MLPRARQALLADAIGTIVGAGLGTSTVTAYIESSTGVAAGGRTGLTNVVTAAHVPAGTVLLAAHQDDWRRLYGRQWSGAVSRRCAGAVLVGTMMMPGVKDIDWTDPTESIPAFLTIVMMPLAVSMTDGIAFGFICLRRAEDRRRPAA